MKKLRLLIMPLMAVSFLASCGGNSGPKEWYEDTAYINSLTTADVTKENPDGSIGVVNTIKVNGLDHKVRLIGVEQDVDNEGNKIHTTWEFVDLLSDENGYSLATYWNDTNDKDTANHNYINSTIRKALISETNDVNWFRYYGKDEDTEDTGKNRHFAPEAEYKISVLNMLPKSLTKKGVLKVPSKFINIYDGNSWKEEIINDKLFLLSPFEMGNTEYEDEEPDNTTYSYYEGADDARRIKKQIKWHDGARETALIGVDLAGEAKEKKYSYAGYNSNYKNGGSHSYLRSPYINYSYLGWQVSANGNLIVQEVYSNACTVAPAFCI